MVPSNMYRQHPADYAKEIPAEGFGGWTKAEIPISTRHTAIVVMHAWSCGEYSAVPGQYRACEYIPRGDEIIKNLFPDFLEKVRKSGIKLIHIGSRSEASIEKLPGYIRIKEKYGVSSPHPATPSVASDAVLDELRRIHSDNVSPGKDNYEDIAKSRKMRDFAIMPRDDEDVVATTHQLYSLCRDEGINHLIYTGFAVNACLTLSPCGMFDMTRHGVMCSVIRELTTAVENKESAATEANKEYGLWSFSLWGGFVFDKDDIEKYLLQ